MSKYNHKKIEKKWQNFWYKQDYFKAKNNSKRPKFYALVEFPYPSGEGLHTGHVRSYTAMDIISRKKRAEGYNVLYPIGWDAFGLPTENYAIKTGIHPKEVTKRNTKNFKRQLKSIGLSFDWSREINTSDPKYYKWTQWMFLQFFKAGLAYKKELPINWCISCKIGLANEEVVDGRCERCGGVVEKRNKKQWMLAITKYAERLLKNLSKLDYLPEIKKQQINWIGKKEGLQINFPVENTKEKITVFTTRPDTIFGVSYIVVAPESSFLKKLLPYVKNKKEVNDYIKKTSKKTEIERTADKSNKTGVILDGVTSINPLNKNKIPIFVADYVLADYGTGAIMAVPAHDKRDYDFAKKYNLPIIQVIKPVNNDETKDFNECYEGEGILINSERFTGSDSVKAKKEISKFIIKNNLGKAVTTYKLRDWVFSRQRYWGEPIPIIICKKCGEVPVPEKDLPVRLPNIKNYKPSKNGESPLSKVSSWVNVKCPSCKGVAKRETDVMPNWAGSSWYFLRYTDPNNDKIFANKKKLKYFMPVDWYNGGMEHTTLHLLYSRFWNMFLYDIGFATTEEPYKKRTAHGMILAEGGVKMSKSKGNVVNPDEIVNTYGADTLRVYEMFMGPFDQSIAWNPNDIVGSRKFIEKTWEYVQEWISAANTYKKYDSQLSALLNKTLQKVFNDIESMNFNTAISAMMVYVNAIRKKRDEMNAYIPKKELEDFIKVFSFFAPHAGEELWKLLGNKGSIQTQSLPVIDKKKILKDKLKIVVQVNGKTRGIIEIPPNLPEQELRAKIYSSDIFKKWVKDAKLIKKEIYIQGKIFNIVI